MTFIVVSLLGIGIILIASSLDNSSLVDTFRKIINGDTINWSGGTTPLPWGKDQTGSKSIQQTPQQNQPAPGSDQLA